MKEVDKVIEMISKYLPNIGHLLENGQMKRVRTFNEFASLLKDPSLDTTENFGTSTS